MIQLACVSLKGYDSCRLKRHLRCQPHLNPTLPPDTIVLQLAPPDDLRGLGERRFDFHQFNWLCGKFGLNHSAHQEVLLLGHRFDGSPLGQQQFFGVEGVHGCWVICGHALRLSSAEKALPIRLLMSFKMHEIKLDDEEPQRLVGGLIIKLAAGQTTFSDNGPHHRRHPKPDAFGKTHQCR
jgi:hypothetical protein